MATFTTIKRDFICVLIGIALSAIGFVVYVKGGSDKQLKQYQSTVLELGNLVAEYGSSNTVLKKDNSDLAGTNQRLNEISNERQAIIDGLTNTASQAASGLGNADRSLQQNESELRLIETSINVLRDKVRSARVIQ